MSNIHWNSYGWDCLGCGVYDTGMRLPTGTEGSPVWTDKEYARLTKTAAMHVCALAAKKADPSDFAPVDGYNVGVENPTLPPDEPNLNPFDGLPLLNPPPKEEGPFPAPESTTPPEEVFAGIERILRDDLAHAHKQWDKGPHEDYRLDEKDRVHGHPQRPA